MSSHRSWMAAALAASLVCVFSASFASAATLLVTEGKGKARPDVAGSIDLEDSDSRSTGYDLDSLAGGPFDYKDIIGIYGRIVSSEDRYTFSVVDGATFNVSFDFDGYELKGGGTVLEGWSGLVRQNSGKKPDLDLAAKGVRIALLDSQLRELDSIVYETGVTANSGASASIFTAVSSGTYTLVIDGRAGPEKKGAALYDIEISVVPLPLPALLLLSGLGGMVLIARRRPA